MVWCLEGLNSSGLVLCLEGLKVLRFGLVSGRFKWLRYGLVECLSATVWSVVWKVKRAPVYSGGRL